ncbi:sialidase family protein [Mycetocola zhadangensis]|uniref:exo-alpha-sialidase n=1 Tax=Mycetocola zhadangensis TaxID=1164595 RepID=A0A3L7J0L1_9MICO|nr:sialidase family protein [Mycetocola zhadangensis]RLQ83950.1 exo-alpha-sialidase [Mycetocola zhadangensis]GGE97472.1 hypothetical protein GCM10011313_20620 [Mycetocola zhadangensis]
MTVLKKHVRGRRGVMAAAATFVAVALALPVSAAQAAPADPPGTFSTANISGAPVAPFASYRIPALVSLGNGVALAAYDGRPGGAADSPNPNSIVLRRSTDGGVTWGAQTVVRAGVTGSPKSGYSDPSFVYDEEAGKVFLFSVYSKDQGFGGSIFGNDDANRQVISAQVSESSDGGLTWSAPRLITNVAKPGASASSVAPGDVRSMFATSGLGIQLKYGPHAGRLIQQFAGDVRQADGTNAIQAYSVYSDDHGVTWKRGAFTGTQMDENKVVELSDGRVMLNTRAGGGYRKVAISTDGGITYGPVTQDRELPDPTNNAAITRVFPDAPANSREAKILLFTNTASQSARSNLTARVSCDDGQTWPFSRQINAGTSGYSTVTRLTPDTFGVLYESPGFTSMNLARFDDEWLGYACDDVNVLDSITISGARTDTSRNLTTTPYTAGQAVPYAFTVRNHGGGTSAVTPTSGNFSPLVAPGAGNCRYLALPAAGSYDCGTPRHTVTAAEASAGYFVPNTLWSSTGDSTGSSQVLGTPVPLRGGIQAGVGSVGGATIVGYRSDGARDLAASPYAAGQQVSYTFQVTNTTSTTLAVTPTAGNLTPFVPTGAGNCRYTALAPGQSYTCSTPIHTVTAAEAAQNYFVPDTSWTVTSGATSTSARLLGAPVNLG